MENKYSNLDLSDLRSLIIRIGAKQMEANESDLYYDCEAVEKLKPGETTILFISDMHTYMYSPAEIRKHQLTEITIWGNRVNFVIRCEASKRNQNDKVYEMKRIFSWSEVEKILADELVKNVKTD